MKKAQTTTSFPLIGLTLVFLSLYNIVYWLCYLFGLLPGFYAEVIGHWKLVTFFEFLAVASLAADIIIRYDQFDLRERKWRFTLTAGLGVLFALRFLLGVIEIFMRGEMKG